MEENEINVEEVRSLLDNISVSKSQGPDEIPAKVLKELSHEIAEPLTVIFRKSLSAGKLPTVWKKANVIPLFKKGSRSDPNNYRPVSLTCICGKLLEKLIRNRIMSYMENNNLFNVHQFGFRSSRSCVTQLLKVIKDWFDDMDNNIVWDTIYLDFAKAFDRVPHKRLVNKLKAYGISGNLLKWISDFLSDRKQRVKVGDKWSDWIEVLSGIPQGSVLGPLLFLIFIHDLPENVLSRIVIFADDTKLYNQRNNKDILQNDLIEIYQWSLEWNLRFNLDKCKFCIMAKI